MSKIMDLYASVNGIDDLMPVSDPIADSVVEAEHIGDYEQAIQKKALAEMDEIKEYIEGLADIVEADDGVYFDNFYGLCHSVADMRVGELVEEEHVDLSDDQYDMLSCWIGDWLADELADFEAQTIKNYKLDKKYD